MATIEILSGDFERETTRIRYSEAGRAHLRLKSSDGPVEDLFLESEVTGVAEVTESGATGPRAVRSGEREKRLFVVLLRGGRKFVARGDFDAYVQFRRAASIEERRRPHPVALDDVDVTARFGASRLAAWFGTTVFARLLPGGR